MQLLNKQIEMMTKPKKKKKKTKKGEKDKKKSTKGKAKAAKVVATKKPAKKAKSSEAKKKVPAKAKPAPKKATPKPKPAKKRPATGSKKAAPAKRPKLQTVSSGSESDSSSSSDDEGKARIMSWDEKRTLSEEIHQLDETKLPDIIEIVRTREKALKNSSNPEEFEIDFNKLGNGTLWELHAFLQRCKRDARAGKKKKPGLAAADRKADLMRELENNRAQAAAVYGSHDDR